MTKDFRLMLPLSRYRISRVPSDIIGTDGLAEARIIVAVDMDGDVGRQAHTDVALCGGITDAQTSDGKDFVRQLQYLCDRVWAVADDTDRAAAKAGSFCRQDECL